MAPNDHDLLIRVDTKVDALIETVAEMKDGVKAQLGDHEGRLKVIEKTHEIVNPEQAFKDVQALKQWKHDIQLFQKFGWFLASLLGASLAVLARLTVDVFHLVK